MKLSSTIQKRFNAGVMRAENGCLEWQKARNNVGYGMCSIAAGVSRPAHRVAWYLAHGDWPAQYLLHNCDNPACCDVDHLREGTQRENREDARVKGRVAVGQKHGMAKLSDDQRDELRRLRADGWSLRRLAERFGLGATGISYIVKHGKR